MVITKDGALTAAQTGDGKHVRLVLSAHISCLLVIVLPEVILAEDFDESIYMLHAWDRSMMKQHSISL